MRWRFIVTCQLSRKVFFFWILINLYALTCGQRHIARRINSQWSRFLDITEKVLEDGALEDFSKIWPVGPLGLLTRYLLDAMHRSGQSRDTWGTPISNDVRMYFVWIDADNDVRTYHNKIRNLFRTSYFILFLVNNKTFLYSSDVIKTFIKISLCFYWPKQF